MNGVKIGDSYCGDWGLFLSVVEIGEPEIETITINVPGRSGVLDCTERIFGGPVYKNRTISLQFQTTAALAGMSRETLRSKINAAWHGQKKKIIFDSDPSYFYEGRITVGTFVTEGAIITIPITCDCNPYKYSLSSPTQKVL
ncbi:hypothetical protein [Eubacterium ramulus]